jgi:hypothetical protein
VYQNTDLQPLPASFATLAHDIAEAYRRTAGPRFA